MRKSSLTSGTLPGSDAVPSAGAHHGAGHLMAALFESLVTHGLRVYAQAADARVSYLRT